VSKTGGGAEGAAKLGGGPAKAPVDGAGALGTPVAGAWVGNAGQEVAAGAGADAEGGGADE
jgi:hypothetical protein